jgi:ankyrin repeat protein
MDRQVQQKLIDLIKAGDLEGLKTRLHDVSSHGLSELLASTQNDEGLTMFIAACEQGRLEIAEFLLEHGSKIDERCRSSSARGMTGLHLAAKNGHLHIVNRLVALGADVNEKDDLGWTPLLSALKYSHSAVVDRLVELGASVNKKISFGDTQLHIAAKNGYSHVVDRLVELGASVNEKGNCGIAPLHLASGKGHINIIDRLIEHGALVNVTNQYGQTPLHCASPDVYSVVDRLIELGASVNETDFQGYTSLHYATKYGYLPIIVPLLRHSHAFTDEVMDDTGLTFGSQSKEILLLLLAYGFKNHVSSSSRFPSSMQDLFRSPSPCPLQVAWEVFRSVMISFS